MMMNDIFIYNIKSLVGVLETNAKLLKGKEMSTLNCINNAYLILKDGKIFDYGRMEDYWNGITSDKKEFDIEIDAVGKMVFPSYCDSHTHLVYAASREEEFVDRIKGLSYQDIAAKGGGILNSVKKLEAAKEEELYDGAWKRLEEIIRKGTGAVEIKSGYGLSLESELKMLRVIKKLKADSPLTIKATFLGAHAIPAKYKNNKADYIRLITEVMMPAIAKEELAEYCDVFCEENYFTKEETIHILNEGIKHGMKPKVHAEQLSHSGGIEAGVACNAISVDHLEFANENDIELLKNSSTMPTILPGAAFFLGLQNPPARMMIDAGLPIAIASDYNPGSSPSGNMNMMLSIACIQYKMTPEEAINASTINTAYAMDLSHTHGSISRGKAANVFITKEIPSYAFLPYSFATDLIETVILKGIRCITNNSSE
jgi:imidazolonepropionase